MRLDRLGELGGIDDVLAHEGRLQDLKVAARQQLARLADVAGIAAELDRVLGGAERGGADAFAGRQQPPWQRAGIDARPNGGAEPPPHVAEVAGLAPVDVFAAAAREHDPREGAAIYDP